MTGIIRPPRGRPSKVTKPVAPPRRQNRQTLSTAASVEQVIHPDLDDAHTHRPSDDAPEAADPDDDDGLADAEAEGEVDDEHVPTAAPPSHVDNMALSTAAGMLANGGGGGLMGSVPEDQATSAYPAPPLPGTTAQSAPHGGLDFAPLSPQQHQLRKSTEEVARESGYGSVVVESALAKRLAREPGLRPAHQRRPDQQLNLSRRSNVEALFAHIAGDEVPVPCKNCHKGHGPWTACVVVDGQMCGSCANCWFNASGARCSFHETRNPQPQGLHPHHPMAMPVAAAPPGQDANPYAVPSSMASMPSHALGSINWGAALALNDPNLGYLVERAFAEVRAADKKQRELMMVEIAAKQFALTVIKYDEDRAREEPHRLPSGLGDEGAA